MTKSKTPRLLKYSIPLNVKKAEEKHNDSLMDKFKQFTNNVKNITVKRESLNTKNLLNSKRSNIDVGSKKVDENRNSIKNVAVVKNDKTNNSLTKSKSNFSKQHKINIDTI